MSYANIGKITSNSMKLPKHIDSRVFVGETDKTNRMSVMHPETFANRMREYTENYEAIDRKKLNKIQRTLNYHSKSTVKILYFLEK